MFRCIFFEEKKSKENYYFPNYDLFTIIVIPFIPFIIVFSVF